MAAWTYCLQANSVETLWSSGTFHFLGLAVTSKKCRQSLNLSISFHATKYFICDERSVVRHAGELIALIQEVCPRLSAKNKSGEALGWTKQPRLQECEGLKCCFPPPLFCFSLRLQAECFLTVWCPNSRLDGRIISN